MAAVFVDELRAHVGGVALGSVGLGGLYQEIPGEAVAIAAETFETAFPLGVRLIDTAPWYNNAETVVGEALQRVKAPRNEYYLATKVGRYRSEKHPNGEFDYSRDRIRGSVQASLAKLGTTYLDVVYLHDVEFVDREIVLHTAIPALAELQREGVIRLIGICGYPLDVLDDIITHAPHPLQVVQSYSHLTLQNDALLTMAAAWHARGMLVINAAPLSMGLLTARGPPDWHPASSELRAACAKALTWLAAHSQAHFAHAPTVEGLAIQYALDVQRRSPFLATMVVGSMGRAEVLSSIAARDEPSPLDETLVAKFRDFLGPLYQTSWAQDLTSLHTPAKQQYTEDGQPLTRQDVQESKEEMEGQWKCEVCDFHNKTSSKACVLCGTDKGFKLGLMSPSPRRSLSLKESALGNLGSSGSFNRTRSFAIRRLNMLNSRQRGARNRGDWVRKIGKDGKRHWGRRDAPQESFSAKDPIAMENAITAAAPPPMPGLTAHTMDLARQHSLAFVSQLAQTPRHPEGRMTFKEYREVDAAVASRGYEISEQDLEILEQVAALPFKDKYSWFLEQTSSLIRPWEDGHLKMRVHRENILVESMEQLLGVQMEHIHMPLRIEFIGEVAIDAGGLEREWFALVTEKLFDETIGLFMCAHVESLAYVINPNSVEASADHLLYFRGAGRLLGRALLEGQLMKAHLALPVLKHLLGVPISFSDLEFVDHEVYRSMKWMKDNEGVEALCLDFSVTNRKINGEIEVIDLKENGRNIEVTDANKLEYIYLRLRYIMLESFSEQLQHLMAGVFEVIPQELILVFDYQELELVLCGVPSIDLADWKAHTQSSDDMPADLLGWFWEVVETFTDEEKARLLQFTTGSSRVPVQGFKALTSYDGRICHFTLKAVPYPENAFPRAHTCFNRIDLPKYKTKKEVEDVMSLVINMEYIYPIDDGHVDANNMYLNPNLQIVGRAVSRSVSQPRDAGEAMAAPADGTPDMDTMMRARIRSAFEMFDKDRKGCVIQEEVSTIMRYLGAYPSEKDIIKKILPEMQEDEPSTFVTYEKFEKKMLEVLYSHEYEPDTDETLLSAFRVRFQVLDPEKKGFIDAEVMKDLLVTKGTPFREKELEGMLGCQDDDVTRVMILAGFMHVAKDGETGRVYYEDYISLLMQELDGDTNNK
ncbi:Aste57867_11553 [Aphanomyces stellatus]|uniref:HECT-type E3 ubiquitin transferase n=1 Tax=Aphanomyces stellatus TaxID=120398 RepID=A0A485KTA7_9STRA|nr:hypothetical protein As57867_011510 [Aphanomyces stellatus]VFT88412.1 Aste57867_11553 [Aphanomyces stellatus]